MLILIVGTGLVAGDSIEPDKGTEKNTEETETVKLSCSYSTNSDFVYLYWYRQYPNREPQYLLRKGVGDFNCTYCNGTVEKCHCNHSFIYLGM
ncbi:hypothetical protein Q8A67_008893 [Cirrhinus molitorella]|uniref:Ig-like domain-containing protein n=1 Tax=Cirrhinus molitorella TaxID=172907 RepID=A0AA88PY80_9TELE|nr:hypothetical protein Q8A67_008893 [Cirrhinus molitorella]